VMTAAMAGQLATWAHDPKQTLTSETIPMMPRSPKNYSLANR